MSEKKSRRPRKSKLVARDYQDTDDDLTEMQVPLKKYKELAKGSAPMEINVKVEVEEYREDPGQNSKEGDKLENEIMTSLKNEPAELEAVVIKDEEYSSNNDDDDDDEKSQDSLSMDDDGCAVKKCRSRRGLLKNIYNSSLRSARCIQQCKITNERYFKELDDLSKTHLSMADRILSIESRNTWGRSSVATLLPSRTELEVQSTILEWKKWIVTSKFRDTPLMYKCYLCSSAWWRLNDFRVHLEAKHSTDQIYCYFESKFQECNIVAGLRTVPKFHNFRIDTDCLKCGNSYEFHMQNRGLDGNESYGVYYCEYCEKKFYTCTSFVQHQSDCMEYRKFLRSTRNDKDPLEFYRCIVCKLVLVTRQNLRKHYIGVHSVSSDLPIVTTVKVCSLCNVSYIDKLFHKCLCKNYSIKCSGCAQSFPTRVMKDIHRNIHNKKFRCRICNLVLDSDCSEMQHIVDNHSKNFRIIYKCLTCKENIFLMNALSTKQHTLIWHKKKFDRRRISFELVVVPSKCVTSEMVEEMDIVTSLSGKFEIKAKPNQNGVLVPSAVEDINLKNKRMHVTEPEADFLSDDEDLSFRIIEDDGFTSNDDTEENKEKSAFANVVLSVKSEENNATNHPKDENVLENVAESVNNDAKANDDVDEVIKIKVEKDDDLKDTQHKAGVMIDRIIKQEIDLKQENLDDDYEMLLSKVLGGAHCSTTSAVTVEVKQEILDQEMEDEEFYEDDIIVLAQNAVKEMEMASEVEKPVKKKQKSVADIKKKKQEKDTKLSKPLPVTSRTTIKCTKCDLEGNHFECAKHIAKCKASYICTKCKTEFVSIEGYVHHFQDHGLRENFCPLCKKVVAKSLSVHLQQHIRLSFSKVQLLNTKDDHVSIELMYYCKDCKESVKVESLFQHWEAHLNLSRTKLIKSKVNMKAKSRSTLEPQLLKRIKILLLDKTTFIDHTCIICKRNFCRNNDVKRHLIEHLLSDAMSNFFEIGGLECHFCYSILAKPDMFRWHMREHAALPVYKCALCCRTFSDSSNFAKHRKTHNFHSVQCDVCRKKFLSDEMLLKHKLLHNKIDPISCNICYNTFFDESAFQRHMRIRHGDKSFKCPVCKDKFESLRLKWDHLWTVHKQRKYQADCPICHQSFRKYQDVRVHLKDVHKNKVNFLNQKLIKILPRMSYQYRDGDVTDNSSPVGKIDHEIYVVYEDEDKDNGDEGGKDEHMDIDDEVKVEVTNSEDKDGANKNTLDKLKEDEESEDGKDKDK